MKKPGYVFPKATPFKQRWKNAKEGTPLQTGSEFMPSKALEYVLDLIGEYEELKDRVHNLGLYLSYVRQVDKTLWSTMKAEFDGLPGFTEKDGRYERY